MKVTIKVALEEFGETQEFEETQEVEPGAADVLRKFSRSASPATFAVNHLLIVARSMFSQAQKNLIEAAMAKALKADES